MKFKTLYVFSLLVNKNGTKRNLLLMSYVVYGQLLFFKLTIVVGGTRS